MAVGHDVAEHLVGLRVDADVSRGDLSEVVHVILVHPAAPQRLHDGVERLLFADVIEVIEDRAVNPPILVDELALRRLDERQVVVHVQHHEQVVS